MKAIKIRDDIYWVGVIDWTIRNFHGYETSRGTTYNAYLILDEKITLIDGSKDLFTEEILSRISSVIDPAKIDVVVCSHLEPDHSGSLDAILSKCPNATVYTSMPAGLRNIPKFCGEQHKYVGVKAGDSISIGKRTLDFIPVPLLHWPDSMLTYCPEEKILFSNDAFGQHYSTVERFDDEVDYATLMFEAQKYYANILMLYGRQALTALKTLKQYDIDLILTGHGISWRKHIDKIIEMYDYWANFKADPNKAVIVYDSMWKSTEIMAKNIAEAFYANGISPKLCDLKVVHYSDVMNEFQDAKYLVVGSPTLNNTMLPNVASFLCYLRGLVPKKHGRPAFAFGSYGWGGQSICEVQSHLEESGFTIAHDMIRVLNKPTQEDIDNLYTAVAEVVGK